MTPGHALVLYLWTRNVFNSGLRQSHGSQPFSALLNLKPAWKTVPKITMWASFIQRNVQNIFVQRQRCKESKCQHSPWKERMGLGDYFPIWVGAGSPEGRDCGVANPCLGEMCLSPQQGDGTTVRKAFRMYKNPMPAPFPWVSHSHHCINPLTCPQRLQEAHVLCYRYSSSPRILPRAGDLPVVSHPGLDWFSSHVAHQEPAAWRYSNLSTGKLCW